MIVGWVFDPPKRHLALYSIFFRLPEINLFVTVGRRPTLQPSLRLGGG
ncbi:MAG: hypothetical protein IKG79_03965 [Neisseriaceae bacterium]|nr:hypothetical protein [Neisseriaceae bacterium]